jgi:S-(hydroxymethyl)glutathione dehydrogenase / alcohol dehydrogenase
MVMALLDPKAAGSELHVVPKVCRAAVLRRPGDRLCVEELEIPDLQSGQVLVKVAFSGVCRSQLMEARGGRGNDRWLPHLLGHEGSGTVQAIGPDVTKVTVGDAVILGWIAGDGLSVSGIRYASAAGFVNAGPVTTFCTHSVVSENRVVPSPKELPLDVAVLFGCALLTGGGMVLNELRPDPTASLVVFGLGGVGLSALVAAKACGCRRVIAIDVSEEKLVAATALGATDVINAGILDPVRAVHELTGGVGVDYCIEAAGSTATIEQGFAMTRKSGGRCLFASHPASGEKIQLDPHDLISGKGIQGSWGGGSKPDEDVPRLAKMYSEERLPLESLLGRRYRLEQVNEALDDLEHNQAFRPLLAMQE